MSQSSQQALDLAQAIVGEYGIIFRNARAELTAVLADSTTRRGLSVIRLLLARSSGEPIYCEVPLESVTRERLAWYLGIALGWLDRERLPQDWLYHRL